MTQPECGAGLGPFFRLQGFLFFGQVFKGFCKKPALRLKALGFEVLHVCSSNTQVLLRVRGGWDFEIKVQSALPSSMVFG